MTYVGGTVLLSLLAGLHLTASPVDAAKPQEPVPQLPVPKEPVASGFFVAECQKGQGSSFYRAIEKLKLKRVAKGSRGSRGSGSVSCEELFAKLRTRQHLYIGGKALSEPYREDQLKILSEFDQLRSLNINLTATENLCPLASLKELRRLIARNNRIREVSCLTANTKLEHLNLGGNSIREATVLLGLGELRQLHLNDNEIVSLEADDGQNAGSTGSAGRASKLEVLAIERNRLQNVAGVVRFNRLKRLYLSENLLGAGALDLRKLTQLKTLDIGQNPLGTLVEAPRANAPKPVPKLPSSLEILTISSTESSDLKAVAGLKNLRQLFASGNSIKDLQPLAGLTALEVFYGKDNRIEDVSALADLAKLNRLRVSGNPLGTTLPKREDNCPTDALSNGVRQWCSEKRE